MSAAIDNNKLPDAQATELARESSAALSRLLINTPDQDRARVQMDGQDIVLPRQAIELLRNILTEMAQGNAVSIMPLHAELTTQEAANILNVSRPHLVKLLEEGQIEYMKVGTHRRIRFQDLMAYKQRRDQESTSAMQELVDQAQGLDIRVGRGHAEGLDHHPLEADLIDEDIAPPGLQILVVDRDDHLGGDLAAAGEEIGLVAPQPVLDDQGPVQGVGAKHRPRGPVGITHGAVRSAVAVFLPHPQKVQHPGG